MHELAAKGRSGAGGDTRRYTAMACDAPEWTGASQVDSFYSSFLAKYFSISGSIAPGETS
jgi:hypothetical protein